MSNMKWNFEQTITKKDTLDVNGTIELSYAARKLYHFGENLILVSSDIDYTTTCIDLFTGQILWEQNIGELYHCAYENGILYFGIAGRANSCNYIAYNALTGEQLWKHYLSNSYDVWKGGGPLVADDVIILFTNTDICGINKNNGKKVFRTKITDYEHHVFPIFCHGMAIIQGNKKFYCYDAKTGDLIKTIPVRKNMDSGDWGVPTMGFYIDYVMYDDTCWYIAGASLRSINFTTGEQKLYKLPCEAKQASNHDNQYELYDVDGKLQFHSQGYFRGTEVFRTKFNIETKEFEDTELSEEYLLGRHTQKSVELRRGNLTVKIDGKTLEFPPYGKKDSHLQDTLIPFASTKLVLQSGRVGGKEKSLLHLVY